MFTIPSAFRYSDLLRCSLFCKLLALNCRILSYLCCFLSHFSKWLWLDVELCHYRMGKVQGSAAGTEIPVSGVNDHVGTQGLVPMSVHLLMVLLLFLPFRHPADSLGMQMEFLCLIGEISLEESRWIQRFSAGN